MRTDCSLAPANGADRTRPAGHGVDRSDSTRSHAGAAPCGRPPSATVARKQGAHAGAPLRENRFDEPFSAGHGLHRSFRDRLRSSAVGAA
jgi:hypothetical protein